MLKHILVMMLMSTFVLAGCQSEAEDSEVPNELVAAEDEEEIEDDAVAEENDEGVEASTSPMTDLSIQILKVDAEAGVTIENNAVYTDIQNVLLERPDVGTEDDFSVTTLDIYHVGETYTLGLMGINRIPFELKNITFTMSIGEEGREPVLDDVPVNIPEDAAGVIEVNSVFPFTIDLSPEMREGLLQLEQETIYLEINDFEFEKAD